MTKHINELAVEAEEKRARGRPKADNTKALEVLLQDEDKLKQFRESLNLAVDAKREVGKKEDIYREDVKSISEVFGLTKAFVNAAVKAKLQRNADQKIQESSNMTELLSLIDTEYVDEMEENESGANEGRETENEDEE